MTDSEFDLDELPYLVGRAWRLGDHIGAAEILPPRDAACRDIAAPQHVLRGVAPELALQPGDFLVAGLEFGTDASHVTVRALRAIGTGAVIARSFGEPFVRCALHIGLPPLQVEETGAIKHGDRLRVDIEGHKVVNLSSGDRYVIRNIYGEALDVLRAGGMAEFVAATRGKA